MCCVKYKVCPDQLGTLPAAVIDNAAPAGFSFDTSPAPAVARQDGGCDSTTNSLDYISIAESGESRRHHSVSSSSLTLV